MPRSANRGRGWDFPAAVGTPIRGCAARPFRRQGRATAPRCAVALLGIVQLLALLLSRNLSASQRACRSSQICCVVPVTPQSRCRCLGDQVRGRCLLCTRSLSRHVQGAAYGRVGEGLAQDWRSARRSRTRQGDDSSSGDKNKHAYRDSGGKCLLIAVFVV